MVPHHYLKDYVNLKLIYIFDGPGSKIHQFVMVWRLPDCCVPHSLGMSE